MSQFLHEFSKAHTTLFPVLAYLFGSVGGLIGAFFLTQDGGEPLSKTWARVRRDEIPQAIVCSLMPPMALMGYLAWAIGALVIAAGTVYGIVWLPICGPSWFAKRRLAAIEKRIGDAA